MPDDSNPDAIPAIRSMEQSINGGVSVRTRHAITGTALALSILFLFALSFGQPSVDKFSVLYKKEMGKNIRTKSSFDYKISTHAADSLGPGLTIGTTVYDFATGGSSLHNIINFGDGTISIGRMASLIYGYAAYPDRATYYTHYNGSAWSEWKRVEKMRTGFGTIAQLVERGGQEVIASHVHWVHIDSVKGANTWTQCNVPSSGIQGAHWMSVAAGKGGNIYVIGVQSSPQEVYFLRSTDAGETFDTSHQYIWQAKIGADVFAYDIATSINGESEKIGIAVYPFASDIYINESTDQGVTWTEELIYDAKSDSGSIKHKEIQLQSDGTGAVLYDLNGDLHVVWSNYEVVGDSIGRPGAFYSLKSQILHWSKKTGLSTVATVIQDSNIIKNSRVFMPGIDGAFITMPDLGISNDGKLFVTYQGVSSVMATTPPYDSLYYCHIYATYSTDNGITWKESTDLTPAAGVDNSFPSLADLVDGNLHIVYNTDPWCGNLVQGNHDSTLVLIKYLKYPIVDLKSGDLLNVGQKTVSMLPSDFSLYQNYPNPFNPSTTIKYQLPTTGHVTLKIYDLLGKEIATVVNEMKNTGTYTAHIDASNLSSGIYFYLLRSGNFTEAKKMVLMK